MELRFRVIYGYNPNDYISITDEFLEKAKYSMISGKVFAHKNKEIRGTEIKRIEPDFRFYTGWNDTYNPQNTEDFLQIKRDVPELELEERNILADNRVKFAISKNNLNLLSTPDLIKLT